MNVKANDIKTARPYWVSFKGNYYTIKKFK